MKINKLSIQSFGKFKDRSFEFTDGLNVIYGENESGKTTLISFIKYMLYGFRGRRSENSLIAEEKYSPWDNSAVSGSFDFTYDGNDYITTRSNGARKEYVTLNNTLGTKSFEALNPGEEIFRVDENAFIRTFCLSSVTGVFSSIKNDDILMRLSNLKTTGDDTVSYEKISSKINSDKKHISGIVQQKNNEINDLKKRLDNISILNNRLKLLSSDLYDTDRSIERIKQSIDFAQKKNEQYESLNNEFSSLRLKQLIKLIAFVFFLVVSLLIVISPEFESLYSIIPLSGALVTLVLMTITRKRISLIEKNLENNDIDAHIYSGDAVSDIERKEKYKTDLLKEMGAIESELEHEYLYDDICSNIDLLTEEVQSFERKLSVIEKAREILDVSYEELKNVFVPELNKRASEIFSSLSGNKYIDIIVTDTFEILVKTNERYRKSGYFSTGMLELMYFSLRLALCEIIGDKEKLPVFLDDCFTSLDDHAVTTALEFLVSYAQQGRQIVFSTCHGREFRFLSGFDSVNIITV